MEAGANCTSKEAAAEISTAASALLCPPLQSQRRNRNQNALWSFSGLADAKRQRWCSLPEPECFYSEGGRGAFPLSLALRKAGKCYCAGHRKYSPQPDTITLFNSGMLFLDLPWYLSLLVLYHT